MRKQVYLPWALVILISVIVITDGLFANSALLVVSGSFLLIVGIYGFLSFCQNDTKAEESTTHKESAVKGLKWYHVCLIISLCGVIFGPIVFTRPYPFKLEWLNFSQTGDIGDTIGGITAPFVGLISILLLWLTLREQVRINSRQEHFNDWNKILSMENHILHLDDSLRFGFTSKSMGNTINCYGVSNLGQLSVKNHGIATFELDRTIEMVRVIELALSSLTRFLDKSTITSDEKYASYGMAKMYLSYIKDFYNDVASHRINWIQSSIEEVHFEAVDADNPNDARMKRCSAYLKNLDPILSNCDQKLAQKKYTT